MRSTRLIALLVLAAAALAVVVWRAVGPEGGDDARGTAPVAAAGHGPPPDATGSGGRPAKVGADDGIASSLEDADAGFRRRMRTLLDDGAWSSQSERQAEAGELAEEIDRMEAEGRVLPAQALLLRVALLRATTGSEAEYRREAAALVTETRAAMDARRAAAERELVAANAAYREREAAIVAEVMSSDAFPDEASRRQALRERLQALRSDMARERN